MNKKISIGLVISLMIISATVSFAITMNYSKQMYDKLITGLPDKIAKYDLFSNIDQVIKDNYYYYDNINNNELNEALANGYVKGLYNNACVFMTAEENEKYAKRIQGKMTGIGIIHSLNSETGYMYVSEVAENSPADQEGLKKGDEIIQIEGKTITADNYGDMAAELEGKRLKNVDIVYKRDGKETAINVIIGYTAQSVFYHSDYWVKNDGTTGGSNKYGYVKITAFYENTVEQFNKAIKALEEQEIETIVFDVRGTKEGDIEYAADIINAVVPASEGTKTLATVLLRDADPADDPEHYTSDSEAINIPIAVLINAETSGVAELFAQDVKDFHVDNAVLVGVSTAGNNTKQQIFELKNGNAVLLPVGIIEPYSGGTYGILDKNKNGTIEIDKDGNSDKNERGVCPDVYEELEIKNDKSLEQLSSKDDNQLQTALSNLWKGNQTDE